MKKKLIKDKIKKKIYFKDSGIDNLLRTFLSSLIVISIFSITPIIVEFMNKKTLFSKDFENNSKDNFKKAFNNEILKKDTKLDEGVLEKYLFDDILNFDDLPSDVVRLSASTIEQLFIDTKYNLNEVRKSKLVKPVSLSLLPAEMKLIENT